MKYNKARLAFGLLIFLVGVASCSKNGSFQDEIVKSNAEEYLHLLIKKPDSYAFISIDLIDSVLYRDIINYRKDLISKSIKFSKNKLQRLQRFKTDIPSLYSETEVQHILTNIEKNEKILFKIVSLESELGDKKNEVASYTYCFIFSDEDAAGAKLIHEYYLQTMSAPNFKLINITDNKGNLYKNPNELPELANLFDRNL